MLKLPDDLLVTLVAACLGPTEISAVMRVCQRLAGLMRDNTVALQRSLSLMGLGWHLETAKTRYSCLAKWTFTPAALGMSRVVEVYPWTLDGTPCFVMVDIGAHFVVALLLQPMRVYILRQYQWINDACRLGNGDVLIACMDGVWSLRSDKLCGPPARRVLAIGDDTYLADVYCSCLVVMRALYTPVGGHAPVRYMPSSVPPSIAATTWCRRLVACRTTAFYVHRSSTCLSPVYFDATNPRMWTHVVGPGRRILCLVGPFFDDCCGVVTRDHATHTYKIDLLSSMGRVLDTRVLPHVDLELSMHALGCRWLLHDAHDRRWILYYDDDRRSHLQCFDKILHEEIAVAGYADPSRAVVCTLDGSARVLW